MNLKTSYLDPEKYIIKNKECMKIFLDYFKNQNLAEIKSI